MLWKLYLFSEFCNLVLCILVEIHSVVTHSMINFHRQKNKLTKTNGVDLNIRNDASFYLNY